MSHFEAKIIYPTTYRTSFCSSDRALHTNEHARCAFYMGLLAQGAGGTYGLNKVSSIVVIVVWCFVECL